MDGSAVANDAVAGSTVAGVTKDRGTVAIGTSTVGASAVFVACWALHADSGFETKQASKHDRQRCVALPLYQIAKPCLCSSVGCVEKHCEPDSLKLAMWVVEHSGPNTI